METLKETVSFKGHRMVRSTHPTTIEITTEEHLTEQGDCIIGVGADKGCSGIDPRVRHGIRTPGAAVKLTIQVGGESYGLTARGDAGLSLSHPHDIVVRKSDFLSDRTLAVGSSASARDLPRKMVRLLQDPAAQGTLVIEVEAP